MGPARWARQSPMTRKSLRRPWLVPVLYVREAEAIRDGFGEPLPPLHREIPSIRGRTHLRQLR